MPQSGRVCEWCREELPPREKGMKLARFCSRKCKTAAYNLKMQRGAQIYDVLITWKRSYKNRHLITEISQMVSGWIDEDKAKDKRAGRAGK